MPQAFQENGRFALHVVIHLVGFGFGPRRPVDELRRVDELVAVARWRGGAEGEKDSSAPFFWTKKDLQYTLEVQRLYCILTD